MKTHLIRSGLVVALLLATTTGRSQTLSITNGLQLWLRADAGVTTNASGAVTLWTDQTTNANNAAQSTDTAAPLLVNSAITNKPVLRFDGADDFLDVPDSDSLSGTSDMASFFVVKFDDFATFRAVWGKTAGALGNLPAPTDIYAVPGSGALRVFRGDGALVNSFVDSVPLRENAFLVLGFDVAGETLTHYLNNQTNGSALVTTNTADANTPLRIGTRQDFATRLKGDLAELLIFNRALSTQERSNVFFYLQTKYNLLNLTPNITLAANPPGPNANVGDVIILNAAASDPDGTVAKVDFFGNGALIGTATQPPYSLRVVLQSPGAAQFTARATDDKGAVANSAAISFTVAASGPPTELVVTNGLQLWLKADAGTTVGGSGGVNQWADQSGNGNNALQVDENLAPALTNNAVNGRPALRFDGANDLLEVADSDSVSITGDITTFFVARFNDFAAGTFKAIWAKTLANQPAPTDIYVPSSGRLTFFRGNGTVNGSVVAPTAQAFATNSYLLGGAEMAGTAVRLFHNGVVSGSGTITAPVADMNGTLRIGSRADGVTRMRGEIAEIVIYNRALSADELVAVRRYLIEKYALPQAIIGTTNSAPQIALTAPPEGPLLQAPTNVAVSVSPSDFDGSVVSVDFFVNGEFVGRDTSAPFGTNITFNYGGPVTIAAIATDNLGGRSLATSVQVCLQGPGASAGLVGYWPLDGNAAAVVGRSGIMVSNPVPAMDRNSVAGGALSFDGAFQQRVEIPGGGGLNGLSRGTISMWVKWLGVQDVGFGGAAGAVLGRQQDGAFSANIIALTNTHPDNAFIQWRQTSASVNSATSTVVVLNDTWRHIAVTFTETNSELYLDGFLENTGTGGVLQSNINTALTIGAWIGGGGSFATATIDDVAVWNRVLSFDEVQALVGQTKTPVDLLIRPDCLSIQRGAGNVTVRWGSEGVLQSAPDVTGTYTNVPSATSPYTTPTTDAARFFRLQSPP